MPLANKYTPIEHEDGRITHFIDHDTGAFIVSSEHVGVAIQNFLHYATLDDIATLNDHLLREYARRYAAFPTEPQWDQAA
jgi:hypothetical protein